MKSCDLYRCFDKQGALLYIGQSLSFFSRLEQHRQDSPWYNVVASVTIARFHTKAAAIEAEKKAIKAERPLHNKIHNQKVLQDTADWYGIKIKTQWEMKASSFRRSRLLSLTDVMERTSLSERQIYSLTRKEKFPEGHVTYYHEYVWVEGDIDRWINKIFAAHEAEYERRLPPARELIKRRGDAWAARKAAA